jgi:hypothetical protein
MGKRQPMRRSAAGARQLLQVRCPVLDCRLEAFFREWCRKFRLTPPVELQCVMCDKRPHVCSTPRHQPYCIPFLKTYQLILRGDVKQRTSRRRATPNRLANC